MDTSQDLAGRVVFRKHGIFRKPARVRLVGRGWNVGFGKGWLAGLGRSCLGIRALEYGKAHHIAVSGLRRLGDYHPRAMPADTCTVEPRCPVFTASHRAETASAFVKSVVMPHTRVCCGCCHVKGVLDSIRLVSRLDRGGDRAMVSVLLPAAVDSRKNPRADVILCSVLFQPVEGGYFGGRNVWRCRAERSLHCLLYVCAFAHFGAWTPYSMPDRESPPSPHASPLRSPGPLTTPVAANGCQRRCSRAMRCGTS